MPPMLLTGQDAANVAAYVASVAGKSSFVPAAPAVLQLPPGLDARAGGRAVAMDLDGTVLDGTFRPRRAPPAIEAAEAAGIVCLIATGRMFVGPPDRRPRSA